MTDLFRKSHRKLEPSELELIHRIKDQAGDVYELLACIDSREGALARTKLEEVVMWAIKGITR